MTDNAFVHTVANAKQHGLWPRKPKPQQGGGEPDSGSTPGGTGAKGSTDIGGGSSGGAGTVIDPPSASSISANGPLKLALTELFEKARSAKVKRFSSVRIRLYESKATWDVHQAVATYNQAKARCGLQVQIEAEGVEEFSLTFKGSMQKANSIKSFLTPQIQTATDTEFSGSYHLAFNSPLPTGNGEADNFIKAMTKYGSGEAYVEAEAAPEEDADA
ncbi:MAG: hypothetical protein R3C45_02185 [Phycisphaerales bacterium]